MTIDLMDGCMDGFDESFDSTRLNKRHSPKLMRPRAKWCVCVCWLLLLLLNGKKSVCKGE